MSNPQLTALPPMETTFEIDVKGEDTGAQFKGEFTYKRPNLRQKAEISLTHQKLKKNQAEMAKDMDILLYAIAFLQTSIIAAPKWWTDSNGGLDLYDASPIYDIFSKTREFEDDWRKRVWGESLNEGK